MSNGVGIIPDDVPIHRIGGGSAANLALKPLEKTLVPPGISTPQGGTPAEAAEAMRRQYRRMAPRGQTVVGATTAESERSGAGAPPVLRRRRHHLPGKSAGGRDHDQRPVRGADREGSRVILLENAQDVGDLFAVTRAGPAPADHDPLADIGGCEADLEPVAHAGHLFPGRAARRRVPGPGPGAWIVAGLGAAAGSGGRSAASTSLAARAFIVSPPPHSQPPGQGSGPAACIGHRRPQPAARQCARAMSTALGENPADGHALLR